MRVQEGALCVQGECYTGSDGVSHKYFIRPSYVMSQAEGIFNHMGPNMARGWLADSAGTRVRCEGGPVDNRTNKVLKVRKY